MPSNMKMNTVSRFLRQCRFQNTHSFCLYTNFCPVFVLFSKTSKIYPWKLLYLRWSQFSFWLNQPSQLHAKKKVTSSPLFTYLSILYKNTCMLTPLFVKSTQFNFYCFRSLPFAWVLLLPSILAIVIVLFFRILKTRMQKVSTAQDV